MASNLKIKRSETSGNPAVLGQGELAYSSLTDNGSNGGDRLYIGTGTETAGNAVNHVVIGGKYFTDAITAATNNNTVSTIVKRDGSGNFSAGTITATLTGNATTATTLENARTIAISGPVTGTATSFNGSSNITISVTALDVSHANVTGTLAVDHGGTGVTTSTGTGSVVLSASPTLTGTPIAPTAAAGTNTTQLATTAFVTSAVDAARSGLDVKASVKAATTANITLSGTQTIDDIALVATDRVLVKNQTTASENGIYVVASGSWTRSTDADTNAEVTSGMFTFVEQGTANADSGWVLTTDGAIVVGTTDLTFVQFSGAGQIIAGAGLTKTGNTLDVGAGTGITVNADDVALTGQALAFHNLATNGLVTRTSSGVVAARTLTGVTNRTTVTNGNGVSGNPTVDIASTYVGQTSITTLGTITTGTWNATTIDVNKGGTGLTTATSRGILYGNGTDAMAVTAASTIDGSFLRGDSSGNPYWSNSIDGGTY
jgi:hypothetical protein